MYLRGENSPRLCRKRLQRMERARVPGTFGYGGDGLRPACQIGDQSRWNLSTGGAYHLARGWIMYCDGCGTQLTSGGHFCTKCGKPIVPSAVASSPGLVHASVPAATAAVSNGRVRGNLHRLAILWMISGILRLMGIGWMMIFGRMFSPFMRSWGGPVVWPFGGR